MTMKNIFKILLIALVMGGCDALQFDDDINVSPNSPSQASGPQLTAHSMLYLSQLTGSTQGLQGQFAAQYLSETQYVVASLYPQGGTSFYPIYQGPLI
ncbi:MAG TPA: SusD/RagB family nutrient-binding outer membrane lipoprotein, partial [Bacteroidetes bacterium]|nr:SusD/RagB family nutrient-binding outer membrane lipoprotein [Bacteroidota bacterium]